MKHFKRLQPLNTRPSFQALFDTSDTYMSGVIGATHLGERQVLSGGIIEYANMLSGHIGHFHLIDSDGTFTVMIPALMLNLVAGLIDFAMFFREAGPFMKSREWWCVDCFNAEVEAGVNRLCHLFKGIMKEAGL